MNYKKTGIISILAVIAALSVSSCASRPPKAFQEAEEVSLTGEAEAVEIPSREAVYVYNNQKKLAEKMVLRLNGESPLLPSGYVRLVGVVSGGKPIACLEIGGRGLVVGEGDKIDDYRIARIDSDNVVFERGRIK